MSFEQNQGQISDPRIVFQSRGEGYHLLLGSGGEATIILRKKSSTKSSSARTSSEKFLSDRRQLSSFAGHMMAQKPGVVGTNTPRVAARISPQHRDIQKAEAPTAIALRMQLDGGNQNAIVTGEDHQAGIVNYLIGNDPAKWHTHVPLFGRVRYANVYPGIDLVYYGNQRRMEYDFCVAPHADPDQIRLSFAGAKNLRLDKKGNLLVSVPGGGDLILKTPVLYQQLGKIRASIAGKYVLIEGHAGTVSQQVRFVPGAYDTNKPLIIDPVLIYSTFLGGRTYIGDFGQSYGHCIAADNAGSAYVTGETDSRNFPTQAPFQVVNGSGNWAFVTKFTPDGSQLVYSTYLGLVNK